MNRLLTGENRRPVDGIAIDEHEARRRRGQPLTSVIVNALVRDASGTGLLVVRQTVPSDPAARWAVPGGKVEPGETVHDALARELREETGLAYSGDVTHAYTVHYLLPADSPRDVVVHVFDGQGQGMTALLGAGAFDSPDPEGDVQAVEVVPLTTAVDRLGATPERVVREPLLAYLEGSRPPGCFWSYPLLGTEQEPSCFEPVSPPRCQ